jgi:uncharacterized cupin superfamily protein
MGSTMRRIKIVSPQFGYDRGDPAGFRPGMLRFGPMLGASQMGASVYELPPGEAICPYHYEYGEEEWLLVLEGRPSVRHPDGTDRLEPWDVVCFPRGPEGAHAVRNETEGARARPHVLDRKAPNGDGLSRQRQDRGVDGKPGRRRDREAIERGGLLVWRGKLAGRVAPYWPLNSSTRLSRRTPGRRQSHD